MAPDFHRATLGDDISMNDYNWSPDGSQLALASVSRDHKHVVAARRRHGDRRGAHGVRGDGATQFESRTGWRVLWATNEVIWHSERDNWGQLYLYDLQTGQLKNQITTGEGPVMQIARIDEKTRTLWFGANGREKGQDPYFLHFYRIGLDGTGHVVSLTPDDGTTRCSSRRRASTSSTRTRSPTCRRSSTLRDGDGKLRDAAREGRHLEARSPPAGSRRCRSR